MYLPASTNNDSSSPDSNDRQQASQLSGETNIDSIRALDEKISEKSPGEDLIKLKRARNSLLNVSKLPPEILGDIFHWNVMLKGDYGGLEKESHNFLLVCHHWFEVALRAPELWSFWGNTPKDWARLHSRSKTASLDLVLKDYEGSLDNDDNYNYDDNYNDDDNYNNRDKYKGEGVHFNETLVDVLQDRASRDNIRRVHLISLDIALLDSIISSLTPKGGEGRVNQMESFVLCNLNSTPTPVDLSNFFARRHFPKLQRLHLVDCTISSWDRLISATQALMDLQIVFTYPPTHTSPNPTTTQSLSILKFNPLLQKVTLQFEPSPRDDNDVPSFRVSLHHLKDLSLSGDPRQVFSLLDRLDYPAILDEFAADFLKCPVKEISQKIGPYIKDYFRRRGRSQSGLLLEVSYDFLGFHVGDAYWLDPSAPWIDKGVTIAISLDTETPEDVLGNATLELLSYLPLREVVYFRVFNQTLARGHIYHWLPNLRTLYLSGMPFPAVFLENEDILQHLENLNLERLVIDDRGWDPLKTFLAHRASSGNRLRRLLISRSGHMSPEDVENIERIFKDFGADGDLVLSDECPPGTCTSHPYLLDESSPPTPFTLPDSRSPTPDDFQLI